MKRDWDLVRRIMVDLENLPANGELLAGNFDGYEQPVVAYHMAMMEEAGLIKGIRATTLDGLDFIAETLTWEGHEFLNKIRQETAWKKIKGWATAKGLDLTIDVIKAGAAAWMKSQLE